MLIYNPTTDEIAQDYCLRNYKFKSQEARTVPDDVGEHLIRKCKMFGLIALDYSEEAEAKYGSLANYKKAKAVEGLSNKLVFLLECKKQEAYGVKESIEKNASPEIAMAFKVEEFERQIQAVKKQMAELELPVVKETPVVVESKPRKVVRRRARRVSQPKLIEKVEEVTVI